MFPDLANVSSLILKESDKRFSWDESASSYKNLYNKEIVKETSRLE
jgi:glycogen synthase